MKAQPGVFMLIERGAVEMRQAMLVGGKMRRDPVDQYPQPGAMGAFDKAGKAFRLAEARAGGIETGGLIAPTGIERMLADGQEFDMGETHFCRIRDQLFGQTIPIQKPAITVPPPGTGMDLIDGNRLAANIDACPMGAM